MVKRVLKKVKVRKSSRKKNAVFSRKTLKSRFKKKGRHTKTSQRAYNLAYDQAYNEGFNAGFAQGYQDQMQALAETPQ